MRLLQDIVDQAVSDDVPLASILRKCLVVASKLKNEHLRGWVQGELNGFAAQDSLPPYRVLRITAKGLFIGPMGWQIPDQPIPATMLQPAHREWATTCFLREPISAYESLKEHKGEGLAVINWPADLVVMYQSKFFEGRYALNRAWQEIPIGAIVALIDTVRTNLLQFALQLLDEIEESGSANETPAAERVEQALQTIIYGGTNIIGNVRGDVSMVGMQVVIPGDVSSLRKALADAGFASTQITELEQAIAADKADGAEKGLGSRVGAWLLKAGSFVGKEGVKVASTVGQAAVLSYFGLAGTGPS